MIQKLHCLLSVGSEDQAIKPSAAIESPVVTDSAENVEAYTALGGKAEQLFVLS